MFMRKPPSEEVVRLVAAKLDPKSVAMASCVSKSWNIATSSEELWRDLCKIHYPSSLAAVSVPPEVTYRRLCTLGFSTALRRYRRLVTKPRISLEQLFFSIQVKRKEDNKPIITVWKPCKDILEYEGWFKFDIQTTNCINNKLREELVVVTWNVVFEGWRGMFTMMDSANYDYAGGPIYLELPGSCTARCSSRKTIKATFGLVSSSANGAGKVTFGMQNRSLQSRSSPLTVDEALRYLQDFLLPS